MSLLRRRAMYKAGELPAGYKRCEWLSSKDDAYLITDYYPKVGDAIEIYFSIDNKKDYNAIMSATSGYDSARQLILLFDSKSDLFFKYFTREDATRVWLPYYFYCEPKKLIIDKDGRLIDYRGNVVNNEVQKNKNEINAPLFLFERSNHKVHFYGKIGTVTFTRGGEKSLNLIPCLNEHNVPCMYDTVSGKSYYNKGTGTFGYKLLQEA